MRRRIALPLMCVSLGALTLVRCGPGLNDPARAVVIGFIDYMASTMHRDRTASQITLRVEGATPGVPSGYREIPIATSDTDGRYGSVVTKASRPGTDCGTSQSTVQARIDDCAAKNGATATWAGSSSGNAGEGVWKLVTRQSSFEVWLDARTQLLWSDGTNAAGSGIAANYWCMGAGSVEAPGGTSLDCSIAGAVGRPPGATQLHTYCVEDVPTLTHPAAMTALKGGMLATTTPAVRWRLPTIYDWKQADINGARFVLPNMEAATATYWSSTLQSIATNNVSLAWVFQSDVGGGVQAQVADTQQYHVRCVGRAELN